VTQVPWDRSVPVDTYWDLGRANSTAIWFAQSVGMQFRILAYYENSLEDISHYLAELQRRGYHYGTNYLPHDAAALRLGMPRTIERTMRDAGYRVRIVPKLSITDGINAAKMVMNSCWFDEKNCEDGLNALKHYRYKLDLDRRLVGEAPIHDWASDGADAFRMLAVVIRPPERKPAGFLSSLFGGEGFTGPQRERAMELARGGGVGGRTNWMGR
jgi:phage terminase large subunit